MSGGYEVRRHERRWDDTALAQAMGVAPRDAAGRFVPTLPPFERQEAKPDMTVCCTRCGERRGLHRIGDEACRNPFWRPGNGRQQWSKGAFSPAASAEARLEALARAVLDERADMSGFTDEELDLGERGGD